MLQDGRSINRFEMDIAPGSERAVDDETWLEVSGRVVTGDQSWSFQDPSLQLGSVRGLAHWLMYVRPGMASSWSAVEPNIAFEVHAETLDDQLLMTVLFSLEAHPGGGWELPVLFTLSEEDLATAGHELLRQVDAVVRGDKPMKRGKEWLLGQLLNPDDQA
jgi:hypothetical protein